MTKTFVYTLCGIVGLSIQLVSTTFAHCEIPCGIYGDEARFTALEEDFTTIEKSMNQINELGQSGNNLNQIVRWVNNKETHANHIREVVAQYFLAQRIKPDTPNYESKLKLLHGLIVSAMKAKQTTDLGHVEALRKTLGKFQHLYFGKTKAHDHDSGGHKGSGSR